MMMKSVSGRPVPTSRGWRVGLIALALVAGAVPAGLAQKDAPPPAAPRGQADLMSLVTQALSGGGALPAAVSAELAPGMVEPADGTSVKANETGLLDVHVRDMDIATLLETLSYEAHANIVTSTNVTGKVSANLYAVTLEQALDAILVPSKYTYIRQANTIYVGTADDIAALRPAPPLTTRVLKLKYLRPQDAAPPVKALLSKEGTLAEVPGEGSGGNARGGSSGGTTAGKTDMGAAGIDYLLVTDYAERITASEKLLAEIDQRPRQVLIEATVLRATLNETNQFGIDFTLLSGVDFKNVGSTSTASSDLTLGGLPPNRFEDMTTNLNTSFAANVADGGLSFGLIYNNTAAFIRALEEVTDVVVVANPKVVALNKQEGEVIVGRRDGYVTTTVTETASVQTVNFLETGTQIRFRPLVNEDGTVRLSVHPKDSNGGLNAANLPFEETTEAHADILVNDGNTLLIGGLFRERTVNSRSQIPVLGNLPAAGLLFGSRNDQTVREEVIILLTVHVLKETPAEQTAFRGLLEDVERVRVGTRAGLVGPGRERLAQAFFHEALQQLECGKRDLAILNLRMTLNNLPQHGAALRLFERLRGERMWDEDGTRMRAFVQGLLPPEPVPAAPPVPPAFERPQVDPARLEPEGEAPAAAAADGSISTEVAQ